MKLQATCTNSTRPCLPSTREPRPLSLRGYSPSPAMRAAQRTDGGATAAPSSRVSHGRSGRLGEARGGSGWLGMARGGSGPSG
eukprot:362088-Prymnesium_polylepis.1